MPKRLLNAIESFVPTVSSGTQSFHVSEDETSSIHKPFARIEGKIQVQWCFKLNTSIFVLVFCTVVF